MRMISERDDRIMSRLARAAGNDMNVVRRALEAVNEVAREQKRRISVEEAVEKIEELRHAQREPLEAA